ncbi:MAG: hypothetical protein NTX50_14725 [Candidatus Sumerlaeota bacterium]|nr:hypothetical protein [Candidatus Sumerlaeota bacterium]
MNTFKAAISQRRAIGAKHRILAAVCGLLLAGAFATLAALAQPAKEEPIDFNRARQIRQRMMQGEKVSDEDKAYLEKAKKAYEARQAQPGRNAPGQPGQPGERGKPVADEALLATLKPLTDMGADDKYKGEDGGLYGGGKNVPPEAHLNAALKLAREIQPLDAEGKPSPDGKIVFISNGMSNTTQEFSAFMPLANADPAKSPRVVIVDCAQGGMEVLAWSESAGKERTGGRDPWKVMDERLRAANVTAAQVQATWIKQARSGPAGVGEYPKHTQEMKERMVTVLNQLKQRFPNLKLAYLSSRIYAGYAVIQLNPEPFAYEEAFSLRSLIQDQIKGAPELNCDPAKVAVKSPLLLWGPYLWSAGEKGRKGDDLVYKREDLGGDGTHPSSSGQRKVADLLLTFLKTDPTAKIWFVGK